VFSADSSGPIPEVSQPDLAKLRRAIFRGSAGSEYGKQVRWSAETRLQPFLKQHPFSRNQLLNESAEMFQNRSATSTDILHEYFVPQTTVEDFVIDMRRIVRQHHPNLLNVTVREINTDNDSFLRYADQNMFSFVMLFVQERTPAGESRMAALTRELIDAALRAGGRYYLPYRLHATPEQFHRAYPQAAQFFELKRKYDPDGLFQNEFFRKYGGSSNSE
jgi:FAD/FMN-containing dehydrogenase